MLARRFGIDARALAVFRITLGFLLITDLLVRSQDLVAFYTDSGVLPREVLFTHGPGIAQFSLHTLSGTILFQAGLFILAGVIAFALLIGYHSRLAIIVSWILLVSLHARNPLLLNAGDSLLRRLLFWGMFLPLGQRWSIDAVQTNERTDWVVTVASAALLIQVVIVYFVNAVFKLRSDIWLRGEALEYILSLDQLTILAGDVLVQYPVVLRVLDWIWLTAIVASVLLIGLTGRARAVFVCLFIVMHLGMLVTLRLGLFPLISIAGLLPFLPSRVWEGIEKYTSRLKSYVADRGLVLPSLSQNKLSGRFSETGAFAPWGARLVSLVVLSLLGAIIIWNAASLGYVALPNEVTTTVSPVEYRWDMYAPVPRGNDGWYIVPGERESGKQIDAFHRTPVNWDRPPDLADTFPSHRWFVYLVDLTRPQNAGLRPAFGDYLCRQWNTHYDDELVRLRIVYAHQQTNLTGPEPIRMITLHEHTCHSTGIS